jgi:hypothetical protein
VGREGKKGVIGEHKKKEEIRRNIVTIRSGEDEVKEEDEGD